MLYSRQASITLPRRVAIVGCGGTGTWAALIATMAGVQNIVLIDHDTLEESNLNRLPYPRSVIGRHKVDALRDILVALRPEATVTAIKMAVSQDNVKPLFKLNSIEAIFDCTDKFNVQQMLHSFATKNDIRYIRCGCTLDSSTVSDFVSEWGDAPDGYQIVPSWAVTAAISGALGVAMAAKKKITVSSTSH